MHAPAAHLVTQLEGGNNPRGWPRSNVPPVTRPTTDLPRITAWRLRAEARRGCGVAKKIHACVVLVLVLWLLVLLVLLVLVLLPLVLLVLVLVLVLL